MSAFLDAVRARELLLGRGDDSAALYRLAMTAYPFLPDGGKWALQRRLERLAHTSGATSRCGGSTALPGRAIRRAHLRSARRALPAPAGVARVPGGHEQRLRELGSHVPEGYLAVSLSGKSPTGLGSGLLRAFDRLRRRVEEAAGIGAASPIAAEQDQPNQQRGAASTYCSRMRRLRCSSRRSRWPSRTALTGPS